MDKFSGFFRGITILIVLFAFTEPAYAVIVTDVSVL